MYAANLGITEIQDLKQWMEDKAVESIEQRPISFLPTCIIASAAVRIRKLKINL